MLGVMFFALQVIFMVGNKSDLDAQRDVTYEEAKQFAEENGSILISGFMVSSR
jgi:GTPase SAR1 family protein